MKKLFISITAAFVFLLSCIIPFTASAHDYTSTGFIDSFFLNNSNYTRDDNNNYYLYFEIRDSDGDRYFKHLLIIPKDRLSITEDVNGNITLSDSANIGFGSPYTDGNQNQSYVWNSATNFTSITINFDLHKLVRVENSSGGVWYESRTIREFESTIPDFNVGSVEVEVFPDLTENFNYSAEFEGNQVPLSAIQVDINNNTAKNYQYAILIQPHGSFLEYESHSNSRNMSIFWGDSPVTYAYMKDEWFYAPFGFANTLNETGRSDTELIMAPCAWHHVAANSSSRDHLYFEQMQLKKGESYDFKVLVFDLTTHNSDGFPNDLPHCTASPYIEVIYNQTFSVLSDTNFNPDSNANGAYSYDNTLPLDTQFDKVKAYYEQSDTVGGIGQVKVTDGADFGNMYDTHNQAANGSSYSGSYNYSGGSNISFNSLIANSSSFLSLLKNVLRYMPDWLSVLLFGGLLAFVLAAIWRKL